MLVRNFIMSTLAYLLVATTPVAMLAQSQVDASDSDVSALFQKVTMANQEKHAELRSGNDYMKRCDKGKGYGDEGPSEICANASIQEGGSEIILLKGCSYEHNGPPAKNPCELLAEYYLKTGRYIEALAALDLPNARNVDTYRAAKTNLGAYKQLGNLAKQKEVLHQLCYDLDRAQYCAALQESGENVDMNDAMQRASDRRTQEDADAAQRSADAEQEQRDRAASRAATIAAISSIGATPQPSAQSPVYRPSPQSSYPSYSSPPVTQSTHTCQNMNGCVKVVSSNYDANHFLHVVVSNTCNSPIRITTSVYAQNRSCTVGQTSNFSPGDSQDMGASTDRNWYQIQADDSVRSSVDGSGCRLIIPNSCD